MSWACGWMCARKMANSSGVRKTISSRTVFGMRVPSHGLESMTRARTAPLSAPDRKPCRFAIVFPDRPDRACAFTHFAMAGGATASTGSRSSGDGCLSTMSRYRARVPSCTPVSLLDVVQAPLAERGRGCVGALARAEDLECFGGSEVVDEALEVPCGSVVGEGLGGLAVVVAEQDLPRDGAVAECAVSDAGHVVSSSALVDGVNTECGCSYILCAMFRLVQCDTEPWNRWYSAEL